MSFTHVKREQITFFRILSENDDDPTGGTATSDGDMGEAAAERGGAEGADRIGEGGRGRGISEGVLEGGGAEADRGVAADCGSGIGFCYGKKGID